MSQPYVYKAISLTATTSPQNLLAALQAVDPSVLGAYREVNLQNDPGSAVQIAVGDDQLVNNTREGYALTIGSSRNYREGLMGGVPIANMYFVCGSGSPRLNVELIM